MSHAAESSQRSVLPREYYKQYADASKTHWWFKGRERILKALCQSLIALPSESRVLDIGSGPAGPVRTVFPFQKITALDLSSQALAANVAADSRVVADAEHVPFGPHSISAICALDVLEHLDHPEGALREWQRALVPGGWLVITVPAYQALWSISDQVDRHRRRYRAGELGALLRASHFETLRLTYFNTLLLPAIALVKWHQRFLVRPTASDRNAELDIRLPQWIERCLEALFVVEERWLHHRCLAAGTSIAAVARSTDVR